MVFKLGGKQFSSWNSVTKQTINQERGTKGLVPIRSRQEEPPSEARWSGLGMEESHSPRCQPGHGGLLGTGHVPEGLLHQGCWSVQRVARALVLTVFLPLLEGQLKNKHTR